jgi:UPF0716 family protein affecting phage T7 exclusion
MRPIGELLAQRHENRQRRAAVGRNPGAGYRPIVLWIVGATLLFLVGVVVLELIGAE